MTSNDKFRQEYLMLPEPYTKLEEELYDAWYKYHLAFEKYDQMYISMGVIKNMTAPRLSAGNAREQRKKYLGHIPPEIQNTKEYRDAKQRALRDVERELGIKNGR